MNPTDKKTHPNWRAFEEARVFVRSLGLSGFSEWIAWAKSDLRPKDIPTNPNKIYKTEGWVSMGDWDQDRILQLFRMDARK